MASQIKSRTRSGMEINKQSQNKINANKINAYTERGIHESHWGAVGGREVGRNLGEEEVKSADSRRNGRNAKDHQAGSQHEATSKMKVKEEEEGRPEEESRGR